MYRSRWFLPDYPTPTMLTIPEPHQDENACSLLARIMRVNGLDKITQLRLIGMSRTKNRSGLLAQLVDMTPEDFSVKHTCIPYLHYATYKRRIKTSTITGRPCLSKLWPMSAFQLPFCTAFYCDACLTEDISVRGYSYWRNTHQFSIQQCGTHGQGLIGIKVNPMIVLPSDLANTDGKIEKLTEYPVEYARGFPVALRQRISPD